ncbi:ATP-binding protein [Mucilaginibacter mali]|uniref:ATP-binding protein n=1 Tax=Mucilaginibacter mali TaxID=2740462 RepID=A0A7D4UJC6_9SPHI|nr:sensor histidine kinase [Mucilaginibacter mali]QKJ28902.1 ATP-binding protein [Mucilaginibacter mali]
MKRISLHISRHFLAFALSACILLLCKLPAHAQRYTFTHYDIENGLIQSQVNRIYQDNNHRIWMGTLGGACRYDGMDFYGVSKASGLINNFVSSVFCDKQGTVWFGTNRGLACLKNQKLYNITPPAGLKEIWVSRLTQDASGTVWGIMYNHLFKVVGNRVVLQTINGMPNSVTTVKANGQGQLFAFVSGMGLYTLKGGTWQSVVLLPKEMQDIYGVKIVFDKLNANRIFLQSYRYLFTIENNTITSYATELLKDVHKGFLTMEQDAAGKIWIGTTGGAYCIDGDKLIAFDSHNGFSDASVSDIYRDSDDNLWLGTQGNGLYRYDGDDYVIYTQSDKAKESPIVMGLGFDQQQNVLLGIDGGGIARYNGKTIETLWLPADMPNSRKVECLYKDRNGLVWVGTSLGGIWQYDGRQFKMVKGTDRNSVTSIREDSEGQLWFATPSGPYYYDQQHVMQSVGLNIFSSSLLPLGKDSMLVGTQEGVALVVNKKLVPDFKIGRLGTTTILCMIKYKNLVLIGTDDDGLYIWERSTGRMRKYQVQGGLKANAIYSLAVDDHDLVWAGTGRGVSRFKLNTRSLDIEVISTGESKDRIVESNQNAIIYNNNKMILGTTKGLTVYNTALPTTTGPAPHIIINAIKLFGQDNSKSTIITNPKATDRLVLSSGQNHLAIAFLGVFLKSPESVTYQYRLNGLDDKFCAPVKNDMVDYPSLPPGHYTFEVRAIGGDGQVSKNTATFSFEITPPFYRTYIFQLGVILFLIFIGVLIQNILHQRKIKQERALEAMKREEKLKIRQQTAEDFHDDLGNKLTRITVLSDILDAKLAKDEPEQKKLVLQIKQNASALYNGTRDILWAMDPKSDNLYEVLNHIKETGIEIFEDTHVEFRFDGISEELSAIKLPMEYSRNITMIFKELLNNSLKHAEAHHVKVEFTQNDKDEATIRVSDDGIGFDPGTNKKGHGINNIKARAKRIDGQINCLSEKGQGAVTELTFRITKRA